MRPHLCVVARGALLTSVGVPIDDSELERVLVVAAHPDDVDFGVAGSVATWTDAGIAVTYCICTDGQAGGFDDGVDRSEIPRIRREEQKRAAAAVGVTDLRFLGHVDGELEPTLAVVHDICRVIRAVRPQRVLTQSPERTWDRIGRSHPDHLAAGEATVRAIFPASRNPYAFPDLLADGLEPWTVPQLWLSGHPETNHAVDITDTFDRKLDAILAHTSQHPDPDAIGPRMRGFLRAAAARHGLGEDRLAEVFFVVETG